MKSPGPILHLLRHAHSSWALPGQRDHERPLDERGRRDAASLAAGLRAEPPPVDRVLCSTASRARETLAIIRPALAPDVPIAFSDDLYALGLDAYHAAARLHRDCAGLLLVGHNPTIEEFAAAFCASGSPEAFATIRQGVGTAHWLTIELPGDDAPGSRSQGILRRVRTP